MSSLLAFLASSATEPTPSVAPGFVPMSTFAALPAPRADEARLRSVVAELRAIVPDAEVSWRRKAIDSVARKMVRKGLPLEGITDRLGVRLVVADEDASYDAMARVLDRWTLIPGSFDDYVANPKPSGYRSLHADVLTAPGTEPIEVQVRSVAMHHEALVGPAGHWRYKQRAA